MLIMDRISTFLDRILLLKLTANCVQTAIYFDLAAYSPNAKFVRIIPTHAPLK